MKEPRTKTRDVRASVMQWVGFISVGIANTIATFLLYQLLLAFVDFKLSYTLSFVAGIVFSAFANSKITFKNNLTAKRFFAFAIFYFISFLLGLACLIAITTYGRIDQRFAPILVALIMLPINYVGTKILLASPTSASRR